MKTKIFLTTLFCLGLGILSLHAQKDLPQDPELRERIDAYRVAFISERLDLSVKEAEAFWPLYNKQQEEKEAIKVNKHQKFKDLKTMSDEEIDAVILTRLDTEAKEIELRRKHYEELKAVLPIKKVAKLFQAERAFHRQLLQKIRGKDSDSPGERNENRPPRKENRK